MRSQKLEALREVVAELPPGTKERDAYRQLCETDAPGEPVTFDEFRKLWLARVKAQARAERAATPAPEPVAVPEDQPDAADD